MQKILRTTTALVLLACICGGNARASLVEAFGDDFPVYTIGGTDTTIDVRQSATSYDLHRDRYLVVWTIDGATGFDLYGGLFGAGGGTDPAFAGTIDDRAGNVRDPAVAYDPTSTRHLIVWSQEEAPGAYEVYGRLVSFDGTLPGPSFKISSAGTSTTDARFDAMHPRVATSENGIFVVTWSADDDRNGMSDGTFEIFARYVSSGGGVIGPPIRMTVEGATQDFDCLRPDIAFHRATDQYVIVYESDTVAGATYVPNGFLTFVPRDPVLARSPAASRPLFEGVPLGRRATPNYARHLRISAARSNSNVLIAYETNGSTGNVVSSSIEAVAFDANLVGLSFVPISDPSGALGPACRAVDPSITFSWISDSWIVSWAEARDAGAGCPASTEIRALAVASAGAAVGAPLTASNVISFGPGREARAPSIVASNNSEGDVCVLWSDDRGLPDQHELFGQFLRIDAVTDTPPDPAPRALALGAAPNPFNPSTEVRFALPAAGTTRVTVYDVRGRPVRHLVEADFPAGTHRVRWDGTDDAGARVASGVYHLRLTHPRGELTRKVALVE